MALTPEALFGMGFILIIIIILLICMIAGYIFYSIAYSTLALKLRSKKGWLAWIPLVGKPYLFALLAEKYTNWKTIVLIPYLLLLICIPALIVSSTVAKVVFIAIGVVGFLIVAIVSGVFQYIWRWHVYERRGYPGIMGLIPLLSVIPYIGGIIGGIGDIVATIFVVWIDRPAKKEKKK